MTRILAAFSLMIILFSCRSITGSGNIVTESRHLERFEGVRSSGSIDVEVTNDDNRVIKIEADDNILPYVITKLEDGMLNVSLKSNQVYHNISVKVYVSSPVLNRLYVSGSGSINAKDTLTDSEHIKFRVSGSGNVDALVDAPSITGEVSGSGTLTLQGRTRDFTAKVSGSGDMKCRNLLSENTIVTVSGSGSARVHASVNLDAKASGSGDIIYSGNPTSPRIKKSGSGSVRGSE